MPCPIALLGDVGGGEVIIIGIIALLLFGKNLPSVSRNIGKALAEFKKSVSDASSEIQREMHAAAQVVEDATQDAALEPAQKPIIQSPTSILPIPHEEHDIPVPQDADAGHASLLPGTSSVVKVGAEATEVLPQHDASAAQNSQSEPGYGTYHSRAANDK